MLERLGPSSLLRPATVITLGASLLLAGCTTSTHEANQAAAEEKEGGWSRCDHARPGAITVVCWKR
jgi:hypothetical protein